MLADYIGAFGPKASVIVTARFMFQHSVTCCPFSDIILRQVIQNRTPINYLTEPIA